VPLSEAPLSTTVLALPTLLSPKAALPPLRTTSSPDSTPFSWRAVTTAAVVPS